MNPTERRNLQTNRVNLVNNLEAVDILDYLLEDGVLTENDCELITNGKTRKERAQLLLTLLPTRGPGAYGAFQRALEQGKYDFLRELLTGINQQDTSNVDTSQPVTKTRHENDFRVCLDVISNCKNPVFQKCLKEHFFVLIDNVEPHDIVDYFYQEQLINDDVIELVRIGKTRRERCKAFLAELSKCSSGIMLKVLQNSLIKKYKYISDLIGTTSEKVDIEDVNQNQSTIPKTGSTASQYEVSTNLKEARSTNTQLTHETREKFPSLSNLTTSEIQSGYTEVSLTSNESHSQPGKETVLKTAQGYGPFENNSLIFSELSRQPSDQNILSIDNSRVSVFTNTCLKNVTESQHAPKACEHGHVSFCDNTQKSCKHETFSLLDDTHKACEQELLSEYDTRLPYLKETGMKYVESPRVLQPCEHETVSCNAHVRQPCEHETISCNSHVSQPRENDTLSHLHNTYKKSEHDKNTHMPSCIETSLKNILEHEQMAFPCEHKTISSNGQVCKSRDHDTSSYSENVCKSQPGEQPCKYKTQPNITMETRSKSDEHTYLEHTEEDHNFRNPCDYEILSSINNKTCDLCSAPYLPLSDTNRSTSQSKLTLAKESLDKSTGLSDSASWNDLKSDDISNENVADGAAILSAAQHIKPLGHEIPKKHRPVLMTQASTDSETEVNSNSKPRRKLRSKKVADTEPSCFQDNTCMKTRHLIENADIVSGSPNELQNNICSYQPGGTDVSLSGQHLVVTFNYLSTLINQGNFDKFELFSTNLQRRYSNDPDMTCLLGYLHASRDLFKTDFDSAKRHIDKAFEIVPKTSNPKYFTLELFTSKTRMYITQKKLEKLEKALDDAKMIIETDPLGCTGRAAGWLYMNDARNCTAQIGLLNFRNSNAISSYAKLHKRAKTSFQKALSNFQRDGGKDGPFGFGYALCRLAILLLRCDDSGRTMDILIPPEEDIKLAGGYLSKLEDSDIAIPKILEMHFALAKCDYQFRRKNTVRALEYAEQAYNIASDLKLLEFTEHANNRCIFLRQKTPGFTIDDVTEEEFTSILFGSSSDVLSD